MRMSEKPVCPHCGSNLIVEIANARHCNQCGHTFDQVRHPIVEQARKRAETRRWPKPQK